MVTTIQVQYTIYEKLTNLTKHITRLSCSFVKNSFFILNGILFICKFAKHSIKNKLTAIMPSLKELFKKATGTNADTEVRLTVSGSNRKYYRLQNKDISLIGVVGISAEENHRIH